VAEASTSSKSGLTRGKAILIGVLSVVLVAVLYIQFGRKGEDAGGEAVRYRPPRPAVAVQPVDLAEKPVTLAAAKSPVSPPNRKENNIIATVLIDETKWKSPPLAKVVAYDPFALPPTFPQPKVLAGAKATGSQDLIAAAAADDAKKRADAAEKLHMELQQLKESGVQVILGEDNQYVAWIGDRTLHVGDEINGFTVTAIDTDGVHIVEKKESP
jgi:hypothetical protein